MHASRLASLTILLAIACGLPATSVSAQTSDELFDSSVLHDIQLTMKPSDWETLQANYLNDTYYPADMKWQEVVVPQVGLRSRGSGSRNAKKPGLKVDFGRYVDQTAFGMKSIVLANAIQDPSMLAQRLGLGMFARMGMPASRVVHARVFVNRDYIGLYELIEPVDKTFLARVFGKDADGKTENGGYLYEYHWKTDYPWDYLGSDLRIYAELFEAKTHESDAPVVLHGPLENLFRRLNQHEATVSSSARSANCWTSVNSFGTSLSRTSSRSTTVSWVLGTEQLLPVSIPGTKAVAATPMGQGPGVLGQGLRHLSGGQRQRPG